GPGSLADYQEILESSERMAGAFVWEWIDHGIRRTEPDGSDGFWHGGRFDYRPNGGSYCLDGLLRPDRVPSPGLLELAKVIEPVRIEITDQHLLVRNAYDVLDTAHLDFSWELSQDGQLLAAGPLEVPVTGPGDQVQLGLPPLPETIAGAGEVWLTVSARLAEATPWAAAGHEVAWGQGRLDQPAEASTTPSAAPSAPAHAAAQPTQPTHTTHAAAGPAGTDEARIGPAVLDTTTGALRALAGLPVDGFGVHLWRAPTDNDRGQGELNNLAKGWHAVGLDQMQHRVTDV